MQATPYCSKSVTGFKVRQISNVNSLTFSVEMKNNSDLIWKEKRIVVFLWFVDKITIRRESDWLVSVLSCFVQDFRSFFFKERNPGDVYYREITRRDDGEESDSKGTLHSIRHFLSAGVRLCDSCQTKENKRAAAWIFNA